MNNPVYKVSDTVPLRDDVKILMGSSVYFNVYSTNEILKGKVRGFIKDEDGDSQYLIQRGNFSQYIKRKLLREPKNKYPKRELTCR